MSDPAPAASPDEDLLDFLGGIDEVNGEDLDDDFADFLARTDIDRIPADRPAPPAQDNAK